MKKVTIIDIATQMQLSRNTVSKALNGGAVTEETRMQVISTAYKMGYTKLDKKLIDQLNTYRENNYTGTIAVLYQKWEAFRMIRIINGISEKAMESGYKVQIIIVDEENIDKEYILSQFGSNVNGIIFLGVFSTGLVKEICKKNVPVTFYNTPVNAQEYIELGDVYSLESFYSMNKLISHCIEKLNCQTFMFIGNAEGSRGVQARMLGFLSACNNHKIKVNDNNLYTRPDKELLFDYTEVSRILGKLAVLPDAIICENDDVAKNVALWAYKNSIQNGLDTVITGFENTIEKDFIRQDILTVEVRLEELGRRLVSSVVDRIKNPNQDISFVTIATYPRLFE